MEEEPSPRCGPFSATVGGQFYIWGGCTEDFSNEKSEVAKTLHVFNLESRSWESKSIAGDPPTGLYAGACASAGNHLYMFGGTGGQDSYSCLRRLDTKTSTWTQPANQPCPTVRKGWCGMVSYDSKLVIFGGYGIPSGPIQSGAAFTKLPGKLTNGVGWTNELHTFDLKKGEEV